MTYLSPVIHTWIINNFGWNMEGRSEKFVEIFIYERGFSNDNFNQIRINSIPNY